ANGNGYVAAIPNGKQVFAEVAAGVIRSKGFDLNGCWVPWYTLHKLFAGLLEAHRYCANDKALVIAARLGDWAAGVTSNLDEEKFQTMLACEHGGMNESLAELYARTGETKYLDLSRRFHHKAILDPLSQGVDCLPGIHGNTQIPKIIGVARRYELAGDEQDRRIADFFWNAVVRHHTYVNGGNTNHEHFGQPDKLNDRLSPSTSETCNTYNMLKLTRHLFQWSAGVEQADYYERALYNHILASQNPGDGMMCYFIPMNMNAAKTYNTPFDSFWCCTGTGMENHAKYGDSIYFHDEDGLYVNLFIPSVLNWSEKGVQVWLDTRFPEEKEIRLTFICRRPAALPLHIRRPSWAQDGMQIRLNGDPLDLPGRPGSYVTIDRTWKNGDALQIAMPMTLRTEAMPDNPDRAAVFYGPILLAGDLGPIGEEAENEQPRATVFVTGDREISQWIERDESKPLTFRTTGAGRPGDVILTPFYKMHHRRYSVYWDFFTEDQWEKLQADYQAEQARLERLNARTVDVMRIGEMQPERDHNLQGERTETGDFMGRKWRHAHSGGWFSFDMKTGGNDPLELMCTYWGSDAGGRTFDILIDGVKIAEQTLQSNRPGEFFDVLHPIPPELAQNKEKITVRLQAHPGQTAGGLFGCRLLVRP
ncbi:MAG: glycoside hydrolase family 127 protein, partial [Candidatus Omnitrophica bacterium]|nr:glycoside hydrolase family 127 protein [Candidatus Omnitrophota bacterium]